MLRGAGFTPHKIRAECSSNGSCRSRRALELVDGGGLCAGGAEFDVAPSPHFTVNNSGVPAVPDTACPSLDATSGIREDPNSLETYMLCNV